MDLATSALATPLLARRPRGDGHCVLVIPGWLAGDRSTLPMRIYLRSLGYDVHGWGQGVNRGATVANVAALHRLVVRLAQSSRRPVSLVGWSLGGHFAYQLARKHPAAVRQVITLGSPARMRGPGTRTVSEFADRVAGRRLRACRRLPRSWDERGPLRVPVTAVYSRSDPVITWRRTLLPPARGRQHVQVRGSHTGLGHNPAVLYVIADRLAQPPGRWRPFRPRDVVRPLFPAMPVR